MRWRKYNWLFLPLYKNTYTHNEFSLYKKEKLLLLLKHNNKPSENCNKNLEDNGAARGKSSKKRDRTAIWKERVRERESGSAKMVFISSFTFGVIAIKN